MVKLNLSHKAKTLDDLSKTIVSAKVLSLYRFNVIDYKNNKSKILNDIKEKFKTNIIIRSSSINEDNLNTSNAGAFDSVMNISVCNKQSIQKAIDQVIVSYGSNHNKDDEIFIQPMLTNVTMSGVIFTSDIDTLSPYYIINFDESGSTDSVTSGKSNKLKTFISFRENHNIQDQKLKKIIKTSQECEEIFDNKFLDIEFAFSNDQLYLLQVRAIVKKNKENLSNINLLSSLSKLNKKIEKLNCPHPNLLGDKAIFSVMSDWNPAEIVGIRPKRLALSLYKELITDETWAYQRDNYGYRNLRSHPILLSFLGIPFIDIRVSFNSFIPKSLEDRIARKLVNHYLDSLSKNVNHHDKVEFEIIYSCYYFGLEKKLLKLMDHGFEQSELYSIKKSLLQITNNIIDVKDGLYKKDLVKAKLLNVKFDEVINSNLSLIDKIYWLIKDVKRYGTLPFAGVARAGFVAIQILRSFVDENIISQDNYDKFLNSLNTVSKQLSRDSKNLTKKEFLEIYGHLRPGTYDILSSRYDEAYNVYFESKNNHNDDKDEVFYFSKIQKDKINDLVSKNNLETSFKDLIIFIKEAIEGREYVKFIFTKHLSKILKYVEEFGKKFNFDREDLSFLDINQILNLYSTLDHRDVRDIFRTDIEKNKEFYQYTKSVKLPSVILKKEDIYGFFLNENEANFITLKKVKSPLVIEEYLLKKNLEGKIVCIQSADPGYDYLFSKNIGGLITCYGGSNSHMAIRCAELAIPAAIGCGERLFAKCRKANILEIDAANKQVKILS